MGARRGARQGLRARQRAVGHLRPRCRAYRHHAEDALGTWEDVFLPDRIERLKKLLDDLQSRLNTAGVAVVRAQLDAWCAGVGERLRRDGLPPQDRVREGLRRQTIIWRQLLTGDKAPEAYLDRHARAALHGDMRALIWRRYRHWAPCWPRRVLAVALAWPHLGDVSSALVAATGALGLTKASILLTVRGRVDQWSSLLWERALAMKIVEATLVLDSVLPPPARERRIGSPCRGSARGWLRARRPGPERSRPARDADGQAIRPSSRACRVRRARLVAAPPGPPHASVTPDLGLQREREIWS